MQWYVYPWTCSSLEAGHMLEAPLQASNWHPLVAAHRKGRKSVHLGCRALPLAAVLFCW